VPLETRTLRRWRQSPVNSPRLSSHARFFDPAVSFTPSRAIGWGTLWASAATRKASPGFPPHVRLLTLTELRTVGAPSLYAFAFRPMRFAAYTSCALSPVLVTQMLAIAWVATPLHAGLTPAVSVAFSGRTLAFRSIGSSKSGPNSRRQNVKLFLDGPLDKPAIHIFSMSNS
jgi:hypothetical protein